MLRAQNSTAAKSHRHVGAVAADFLGHDRKVDDIAADAAIFLREGQGEQSGFDPGVVSS